MPSHPCFERRYARVLVVLGAVLLAGCGGGGAASVVAVPANLLPVADAGPDTVGRVNTLVTLDGTASKDPESLALAFQWTQVEGVPVFLSSSADARPTFTPTVAGTYVFTLAVNAGGGEPGSTPAEVTIVVIDDLSAQPRRAPGAVARAAGLRNAAFLTLPPSLAMGPPDVVLADGAVRTVTVVDLASDPLDDPAPSAVAGLLEIHIVAGGALFARLYVQLLPGDEDPVRLAFPDGSDDDVVAYAIAGEAFVLDGSRSQDDGVIRTFTWTQVSGPFRYTTDDTGLSVVPVVAGGYVFDLVVTDDIGLSSFVCPLRVPVVPAGLLAAGPPTARTVFGSGTIPDGNDETPEVAVAGTPVVLSGSASVSRSTGVALPGGGDLAFSWQQVRGPTAVLLGTTASNLSVVPQAAGAYAFELTVTDGNGASDAVVADLTVAAPGQPPATPVLLSIPDQVLPLPGDPPLVVVLDGSLSTGAGALTYRWTQLEGLPVFIEDAATGRGSVRLDLPGVYAFELRVFDGSGLSAPVVRTFRVR